MKIKFPRFIVCIGAVVALLPCAAAADTVAQPSAADCRRIAGETDTNLQKEILDKWFPRAVDEKGGGFYEIYNADWSRGPGNNKSLVYQSRLTWTSAQAARRYPTNSGLYLDMTRRGAAELMNTLWDKGHGGFYWTVKADGRPVGQGRSGKQVYGIAFGIYSLAASYQATKDPAALEFAEKGFRWLDAHAHDDKHGGYYEVLNLDGSPAPQGESVVSAGPNQKSMNTSIHVLEALTGLYKIWPDPVLKVRLQEMYDINLNKIYTEPGYLTMFFNADWSRLPGNDSFGHDVETGFLLVEAADALGIEDGKAWIAARHLEDHALQYGWDKERGGLYDSGRVTADGVVSGGFNADKVWWTQAEQLNVLLLLHRHYGKETTKYWDAFVKQWNWITKYQVDHQHGGWYPTVAADGTPVGHPKSDGWTECYHQGRAMLTVSETLAEMAEGK